MANSVDITVKGQIITVVPQNVQCLVKYPDSTYAVVFEDGTSLSISKADYGKVKALDYSQGGGQGGGGIQSSTISNMEFDGNKTLTINGTPFAGGGGGSNMVYDTTTGVLSGAKDQDGNDVEFEFGTVTIII